MNDEDLNNYIRSVNLYKITDGEYIDRYVDMYLYMEKLFKNCYKKRKEDIKDIRTLDNYFTENDEYILSYNFNNKVVMSDSHLFTKTDILPTILKKYLIDNMKLNIKLVQFFTTFS